MLWPVWARLFGVSFDWLQVEVTTHCNAACVYCPRTVYSQAWHNRHLSLDMFRRLLPDLPRTPLLHLQGWGEPFLNPDFFTMLSLAKGAGCRVGTTTNGMLLDAVMLASLIDAGLDLIAFSLAGLGHTNDRIRRGTRFAQVLETLDTLNNLKIQKGVDSPKVHIAYMLLSSGLEELPRLPQALRGLGVTQVVISLLDFVADSELAGESLRFRDPQEHRDLMARLADLANQCQRQGLAIHYNLPPPGRPLATCSENIGRTVCVAADGAVAPCVFLNLPARDVTYISPAGEQPYQRLTFGSLTNRSIREIWRAPAYSSFRRAHLQGPLPFSCRKCVKLGTYFPQP